MRFSPFLLFVSGVMAAQPPGTFTPTGSMTRERVGHAATLLTNGKVLILGGSGNRNLSTAGYLASAELYDPATGMFTPTGSMTMARLGPTATMLADGRVLVVGGYGNESGPAELYDPLTGAFTRTGDMLNSPDLHTAILLANGKVLIAGRALSGSGRSAELYDPASGAFAATGPMVAGAFYGGGTTLLPDGRVLFAEPAPEIYDPSTGTFSLTSTSVGLYYKRMALLHDGDVLFTGGQDACDGPYAGAELYDPLIGTFTATGSMTTGRGGYTPVLLPDGKVLIAGGFAPPDTVVASSELYDPVTGVFSSAASMTRVRTGYTATLLLDGKVLIAGGASPVSYANTSSAELYRPAVLVPAPVLLSLSGDGKGQGAILHAGTSRLVSAADPAIAGEALEIYCTGLIDGSVIPPQVSIGGRMAEILFFGNTPGYTGLNQINVRVPSGVAPGPAVPVRLTYIRRPSNEVTIGVR